MLALTDKDCLGMRSQLLNDELFNTDHRLKATLRIALASTILLTPFALDNLVRNNYMLGLGLLAVFFSIGLLIWQFHDENRAVLVLYALAPALVIFLTVTIKQQGMIAVLWSFPVLISYYCMLDDRKALLANLLTLAVILPQAWQFLDFDMASQATASLVAVSLFSAISARATRGYQQCLKTHAVTDPLTGLFNRSLLNVTLKQAWCQHQRTQTPMTILLLDLDHFKQINDAHGHSTGDHVLAKIGQLLQTNTRLSDTCFRIGGEEFLCLMYGAELENGKRLAETLRQKINSAELLEGWPVSASIGVACLDDQESCDDWLKRSDEQLYRAKHCGRNLVSG
ncbi:hypothetical protein AB833_07265 [Chromatiales bacterium (ex Bugula neritina AB1)]|nr:hypothetical protein AB833_07265 [Chromatiales bacterium (ex Bugula neritina AB1)]